jgi:hypothetical protein
VGTYDGVVAGRLLLRKVRSVSILARAVQGLAVGWSWHANNMRAGLLTAASKVDEYTRSLNRGRP